MSYILKKVTAYLDAVSDTPNPKLIIRKPQIPVIKRSIKGHGK